MAVDPEIGRINVLLEYLAECGETNDLAAFIRAAGGRVRWVVEFQRLTLAIHRPTDCQYWTVTRDGEHLEPIAPAALPPVDREMIATVLRQRSPLASARPIRGLCLPLQAMELELGAICFTTDRGHYDYRDERFVHQIAQFLSSTIARLLQEETIRRQAFELGNANRAKDEFLAILGHELRNPLAPILLSAELLGRRLGDQEPPELAIIKRQAQHVLRLVDDLLDVARLTRGNLTLVRSLVETSSIVARAIEMASPLIEIRRHRLEVDVPGTGLWISGDESRLAQVIANLLTNAARYTDEGGLIRLVARSSKDEVVVVVSDNGCGISPELLPRVFSMFVQAAQAREDSRSGLGLGLAIAKSITEMHGGSVSVTSDGPGRGSTFTVRLPLAIEEAPPVEAARSPEAPARTEPGLRILVVDDNVAAAESLAEVLELLGNEVRVAHDGVEALRLARESAPDLALLDIGLPVIDGYELAQRLRAEHPSVRLVAVSGYGQDADRAAALEAGFSRHLVKPVSLQEIESVVTATSPGPK